MEPDDTIPFEESDDGEMSLAPSSVSSSPSEVGIEIIADAPEGGNEGWTPRNRGRQLVHHNDLVRCRLVAISFGSSQSSKQASQNCVEFHGSSLP